MGAVFRERLQIDTNVPDDAVPFTPGLVELGYDLRPKLWIECSEGGPARLHKIAVKCPGTELWILQRSPAEAEALRHGMKRAELRRDRWNLLAFDPAVFDEVCGLIRERNTFHWFRGDFDPPAMQFELNGLWFDTTFEVSKY